MILSRGWGEVQMSTYPSSELWQLPNGDIWRDGEIEKNFNFKPSKELQSLTTESQNPQALLSLNPQCPRL
jgi:hypothetical protein